MYKLPITGDHIDLSLITSVRAHLARADSVYPPIVSLGAGTQLFEIKCQDDAEAIRIRDEIAEAVNGAQNIPIHGVSLRRLEVFAKFCAFLDKCEGSERPVDLFKEWMKERETPLSETDNRTFNQFYLRE